MSKIQEKYIEAFVHFNSLELDQQKRIIKKYFPIGTRVVSSSVVSVSNANENEYSVIGYIERGTYEGKVVNLQLENFKNIEGGNSIHPGHFVPSQRYIRKLAFKELEIK